MRRLHLLLLVVLLVAACNGEPEEETITDDPEPAEVTDDEEEDDAAPDDAAEPDEPDSAAIPGDPEAVADQPADAQATFVTPRDGDVVTRHFPVQAEVAGVEIVPAGPAAPGQGHVVVVVGAGCLPDGAVVPGPSAEAEADGYYHLDDGSSERQILLEPGTYELCLQLADGEHRAFGQTDVITITVVAGRG